MAEERNAENFALGLIVAAIAFMLLRKEFAKGRMMQPAIAAQPVACGCGGGIGTQETSINPGISIGGQSYSTKPFAVSPVTPASPSSPAPNKQWYAGSGPGSGVSMGWGG